MKMGEKEKFFLAVLAMCDILVTVLTLIDISRVKSIETTLVWDLILLGVFLGVQVFGGLLYFFRESQELCNVFVILLIAGTALYNFAATEMLGGVQYNLSDGRIFMLNCLVAFVIIVVLYRVIRRLWVVMGVTNTLFLILGIVNHYYCEFRGEPFELADLAAADTALKVIGQYRFKISYTLAIVLITELALYLIIFGLIRRYERKLSLLSCCMIEALALGGGVYLTLNAPSLSFFSIRETCHKNGYLYSFPFYCKELYSAMKPEYYNAERVKAVLENYREDDEGKKTPDIIVVMNESFSDLPAIYDFETNEDVMPYIHSMSENTIKGNLLVSCYGGSTINTEFEFMTGNSMAFMKRNSYPYTQYIRQEQQSLASMLKSRGYVVTGYHPYAAHAYSRDRVYPFLGLEDFYSILDDLPSRELLREFVSDKSDYENLIYLYEKNRQENNDAPVFLFNVTMQNHGDYGKENSGFEATIKPKDKELQSSQVNEYLSLIRESDRAFEQLISYFEKADRDVIVLLFGDHQPGIASEMYQVMAADLFEWGATEATKQKKYLTNYVIWSNFDIEEQDERLISANYLRTLLLQNAGCGMNCYDRFLLDMQKEYPVINVWGYYDGEGNWHNLEEMSVFLEDYSCLEYYNVFDHTNLDMSYFK